MRLTRVLGNKVTVYLIRWLLQTKVNEQFLLETLSDGSLSFVFTNCAIKSSIRDRMSYVSCLSKTAIGFTQNDSCIRIIQVTISSDKLFFCPRNVLKLFQHEGDDWLSKIMQWKGNSAHSFNRKRLFISVDRAALKINYEALNVHIRSRAHTNYARNYAQGGCAMPSRGNHVNCLSWLG